MRVLLGTVPLAHSGVGQRLASFPDDVVEMGHGFFQGSVGRSVSHKVL
jgi:hypothetical protein